MTHTHGGDSSARCGVSEPVVSIPGPTPSVGWRRRRWYWTIVPLVALLAWGIVHLQRAPAHHGLPSDLAHATRLVLLTAYTSGEPVRSERVSAGDFLDWRERASSFEGLAAFRRVRTITKIQIGRRQESARIVGVTPGLFSMIGVRPAAGRDVQEIDEALISHRIHQQWFQGAPVLGARISFDGTPLTIVGVMPPGVEFPAPCDLWVVLTVVRGRGSTRGSRSLGVIGILRPGVDLSSVQTELNGIAHRIEGAYPESNTGWRPQVSWAAPRSPRRVPGER
jgi:hypothetical protein